MEKNGVIESDSEVYQVWQLFNEKKYTEIDFYMEILPLNLMYADKKKLFDNDIQSIDAEAPQPSEPTPIKKSHKNIKSVTGKRRRGKIVTPTPAPAPTLPLPLPLSLPLNLKMTLLFDHPLNLRLKLKLKLNLHMNLRLKLKLKLNLHMN